MDKAFQEGDIHWTVSILAQDPELVANRERLYSALGLPLAELHDLKTHISLHGSGSDVFFRTAMSKWMSREGALATFTRLVQTLKDENFIGVAGAIETSVKSGDNKLRAVTNNTVSVWFDVPPKILMFTGRTAELEELHKAIVTQNTEGTVITTLSGLGGIGKTALSVHYAWTYQKTFYSNVIWLNSETKATLTDSFHRLVEKLGIDTFDSTGIKLTLERMASRVYDNFHHGNTLFVFDNVESYADIKPYLPPVTPNKVKPYVLLTSRNRNWNRKVNVIVLNVFTEIESVDFLKKYLDLQTENELTLAKEISAALHYLPLGVRQAGAYIHEQRKVSSKPIVLHMKDYLIQLDLNFEKAMTYEYWRQTDDQYEKTTFATWNVTLTKIEETSPLAVRIMELISYLNPDNIPTQLFDQLNSFDTVKNSLKLLCCGMRNGVAEESTLDEAIKTLNSYSMINRNDEKATFNVHRLLQKVIQIQVESKSHFKRLEETVQLIKEQIAMSTPDHFEELYLIHASSLLSHLKTSNFRSDKLLAFQVLVTEKRNIRISEQLNKLFKIYELHGHEAAFDSFHKFDKSYGLTQVGSEKDYYVDKYHGTFLDFIFNEIAKLCPYNQKGYVMWKITEEAVSIFKMSMKHVELSVSPNILQSVIATLLWYNYGDNDQAQSLKLSSIGIIECIYQTVILNRKTKYFYPITCNGKILKLFQRMRDVDQINKAIEFVKSINAMLSGTQNFDDAFVKNGLADSLIKCRKIFDCPPLEVELTLAELRRHDIFYDVRLGDWFEGVNPLRFLQGVKAKLNCLAELGRFDDVFELISKYSLEIQTLMNSENNVWSVTYVNCTLDIGDNIFELACNSNCRTLRKKLLGSALNTYSVSLGDCKNWPLLKPDRTCKIMRCSIELDRFDIFAKLFRCSNATSITYNIGSELIELDLMSRKTGVLQLIFNNLKETFGKHCSTRIVLSVITRDSEHALRSNVGYCRTFGYLQWDSESDSESQTP